MDDYLSVLRIEFEAGPGDDNFLIQMRCMLHWDKVAFDRVLTAMRRCCEDVDGHPQLERWVAGGFWYFSWAVKDWTTHPNFPRDYSDEYYEAAYERLNSLAFWFFFDEFPYIDATGCDPIPYS